MGAIHGTYPLAFAVLVFLWLGGKAATAAAGVLYYWLRRRPRA